VLIVLTFLTWLYRIVARLFGHVCGSCGDATLCSWPEAKFRGWRICTWHDGDVHVICPVCHAADRDPGGP
jgi:hypothetical protein